MASHRYARLLAVVAAATALASYAAPAAAAAKVASRPAVKVAVLDCGLGKALVRPRELTIACADANALGVNLRWASWGSSQATAYGTYTWNICVPYCAASKKWAKTPATFSLTHPAHTSKGWLFERLTVHITGKVPAHMDKVQTYSEAPRR